MSALREIYERLNAFFAVRPPKNWWPDDAISVIVGAVLVPGTSWKNVARVLDELQESSLLSVHSLHEIEAADLEQRIRPVGFQPKKAKCLKGLMKHIIETADGDLERFLAKNPDELRCELLSLYGIGPATADNILLYAGKQAIYSIDKFTRRILQRHGILAKTANDKALKVLIEQQLPKNDADYYNRFQEFVVRIGREYCGKSLPKCSECPLAPMLPAGGAVLDTFAARPQQKCTNFFQENSFDDEPNECHFEQFQPNFDKLSQNEKAVIENIFRSGTLIDDVIEKSGLPAHRVLAAIGALEMQGYVLRGEGGTVCLGY